MDHLLKDRILLINYDWPPGLSGVRRLVKFAEYLPDHDFEPLVLCAPPNLRMPLDFDILEQVKHIPTYRVGGFDPYRVSQTVPNPLAIFRKARRALDLSAADQKLSAGRAQGGRIKANVASAVRRSMTLPDDRFPWLATALPAADRLMRNRAIRYVLTSSYPNTSHLIGLYLKKRYRIHWHADFRDGWTQNPYFADYLTPLHRRLNQQWEREVCMTADTITAVSEPISAHLSRWAATGQLHTLPNGFDPADLADIPPVEFDQFTIAYTGTMFMQRSPDSFFAAVRGLLDCYPGLIGNFQILFRSNLKPAHRAMIRDLGLGDVVKNLGMGTFRESLQLQKCADVLLVLEGAAENGEIMLTQKVFEYLGANKPILAITPEGALADLVRSTRSGMVIHPDNVFRIKETLMELFLNRMTFDRREPLIQTFNRQDQVARLAQILRSR